MVQVTIDGKQIEVADGTTVLNAARQAGIKIPTLCDHPKLTPYGGCRLCIVEVEKMRTLQTACTLPVSDGMVVHSDTPTTKESRKFVLSMLFSERNHFCMYCQVSGGECELQNAALFEGMDHWPLQPTWTNFPVDSSHPYYIFDHNRCILCRRCVRACAELTANFTLATENRGYHTMIIADYNVPLGESTCVSCGNCVQSCPTGSLIDRQSAYRGLAPDAEHIKSTCVGCSVGCGVDLVIKDNQLLRVNGDYDAEVNGGMMCELGRFKSIYEKHTRFHTPMVRKNGVLKAATWEEAYKVVGDKLKSSKSIAALASTRLPAEALSAFKELFGDKIKSKMVTSIEENFPTQGYDEVVKSKIEGKLADLRDADLYFVIGADLFKSHQVAGFYIKQNLSNGARLILVDTGENQMEFRSDVFIKPKAGSDFDLLTGLAEKASPEAINKTTYVNNAALVEISKLLEAAKKPVFIFGKGITAQDGKSGGHSALSALLALAKKFNGKVFSPKGKANSLAAHAYSMDMPFSAEGFEAIYIALGDDEPSQSLVQRLEKVPFLAVEASYESKLTAKADVVFPAATWSEQSGHYLSLEGRLQETAAGIQAPEGVLSNEEILKSLAKAGGYSLSGNWKTDLQKFIWE